ncbi:MAG: DUF192 domain-containing protein [Planctomycetes bacterium]|nr:DUF192 domain-containing protein [Planctomycetota bacterium]
MKLLDVTNGSVVAEELEVARTDGERTRGLLGRDSLPEGHALLLERCRLIHMFFMRFPIDVVYLNAGFQVVKVVENLAPWRLSGALWASATVELPVGAIRKSGVAPGHRLEFRP